MLAIISDIEANLEALEAVLADADQHNVDKIICLGDIIGYGPDPIACLELAMTWDCVLEGHSEASAAPGVDLSDPYGAIIWNRSLQRFRRAVNDHARRYELLNFLAGCGRTLIDGGATFVHGSPQRRHDYIFPEYIFDGVKMQAIWDSFDSLCFCGHSHIPGVFQNVNDEWTFKLGADEVFRMSTKTLCTVGSVGQPRDADNRACYVLYDKDVTVFRRVDYDIDKTIRKLKDRGDDDFSGDRLRAGR